MAEYIQKTTTQEVPTGPSAHTQKEKREIFRTYHIVYYILSVLEALLAFRFVLRLFGANPGAGFVDFIYSVSGLFLAPFFGVFGTPRLGGSALEFSTLLAMAVYAALAYAVIRLIRIITATKEGKIAADVHRQS